MSERDLDEHDINHERFGNQSEQTFWGDED
jgi:hypothetical protein